MPRRCAVSNCQSTARRLCYGCNLNFCLDHMLEHDLSLNSKLDPLAEQINYLEQRLKTVDFHRTREQSYAKLEQWRIESHRIIERYFQEKSEELERFFSKNIQVKQEEIQRIRLKMSELVREQEATHTEIDGLISLVRDLEKEIGQMEEKPCHLNIQSLVIDPHLIWVEDESSTDFDLNCLSSISKRISYPRDNWAPIACNDQYLLIHQEPNLCLVDRDLNIIKQTSWMHGTIYDMSWSTVLHRFILLNGQDVFLIDGTTMSIEHLSSLPKRKWLSCTTSDSSLYLSTKVWASSLFEYRLTPTIELVKQWQSPETCTHDEVINSIVYHQECLAMMIKNPIEKRIQFEMRSARNLERLWTVKLNLLSNFSQNIRTRACLLHADQWLIIDRNTSRIYHLSKEGKLKGSTIYNPPAFSGLIFDQDLLAISTAHGVNLHKLNLSF